MKWLVQKQSSCQSIAAKNTNRKDKTAICSISLALKAFVCYNILWSTSIRQQYHNENFSSWQLSVYCFDKKLYTAFCVPFIVWKNLFFFTMATIIITRAHQTGRREAEQECESFIYLCITKWALSNEHSIYAEVDGTKVMESRTQKPHNKNSPVFAAAAAARMLAKSRKWTPIYICQTKFCSLLQTKVQWETDCVIIMVSAQNRISTHFTYCDHTPVHTHRLCQAFVPKSSEIVVIHPKSTCHVYFI